MATARTLICYSDGMDTARTRSRCLLILLDGIADRAWPALAGRTPLQCADTPHLNALARAGCCGLWHASQCGQALPSEAAHFFLLGYGPEELPGRGWLEALGHGVEMAPGEVALLAQLALVEPGPGGWMLLERRPRLEAGQARELMAAAGYWRGAGGAARLVQTKGGSGILVLSHPQGLSPRVTDSDPLEPGGPVLQPLPWAEAAGEAAAARTCGLLAGYLEFAHRALASHPVNRARAESGLAPVNAVVTQRAGAPRQLPSLEQRWGLKVLSISSSPIYRGLFRALGAEAELVAEARDPARAMAAKLELALARLDEFDLVHLHSKAPDEAAHAGDPAAKAAVIEALDAGLAGLGRAMAERPGLVVAATGDHATPSGGRMIHSGEPSPLVLAGPGLWRDAVGAFSELDCAAGALGLLRGRELMLTLLNALDRGKLLGLRDCPQDLPYYPGPRQAFAAGSED